MPVIELGATAMGIGITQPVAVLLCSTPAALPSMAAVLGLPVGVECLHRSQVRSGVRVTVLVFRTVVSELIMAIAGPMCVGRPTALQRRSAGAGMICGSHFARFIDLDIATGTNIGVMSSPSVVYFDTVFVAEIRCGKN